MGAWHTRTKEDWRKQDCLDVLCCCPRTIWHLSHDFLHSLVLKLSDFLTVVVESMTNQSSLMNEILAMCLRKGPVTGLHCDMSSCLSVLGISSLYLWGAKANLGNVVVTRKFSLSLSFSLSHTHSYSLSLISLIKTCFQDPWPCHSDPSIKYAILVFDLHSRVVVAQQGHK